MTVPDGSAETFDNNIGWVACNLEYPSHSWHKVRTRALSMGIRTVPWIRLCHVEHGENFDTIKQRLQMLVAVAQAWGTDLIMPNYEREVDYYLPNDVAGYLYDVLDWRGETGWSTLAWLQNGPSFSRMANRGDSVHLQIFPTDTNWPLELVERKMGDCVWHARVDKGFDYVGVTYQTYAGATPHWFDVSSYQHSVFTGNLIGHGQWSNWFK